MSEYVAIGYTQKSHGLKGELKMHIEPKYLEDFLKNERVYVDVKGIKIPYFIEQLRGTTDLIVQLEDVRDRDAAIALQSRDLYLKSTDLIPEHKRELDVVQSAYAHLAGYTIIDAHSGTLGAIEQVLDMPQQEMAVIQYKGKEVFIPLIPQFVRQIDETRKEVLTDLPEGLLDV
jgi:16S rRNA processing protein RimM